MNHMRRRVTTVVGAVALVAPLLVVSDVAHAAVAASRTQRTVAEPAAVTVQMIHFTFDPPTITIPAGSTVTWTYNESATDPQPGCESPEFQLVPALACPGHSTTAVDVGPDGAPLWDSGVHRADGFPYSRTFTTPGTYSYYCVVHGGPHPNNPLTHMDGTIIVTAANGSPAAEASPPEAAGDAAGDGAATGTQVSAAVESAGQLPVTGGGSPVVLAAALLLIGVAALSVRRRAR